MMLAPSLPLVYFGAACASSTVFAFVLGAVLRRAGLRWPALSAHRSVWLLAQAAVVLVFALACAPLPRSAVAPVLALPQATAYTAVPSAGPARAAVRNTVAATPVAADSALTQEQDLALVGLALDWLPVAWLGVYLVGLLWYGAASLRAQLRWNSLMLRESRVVGEVELRTWAGLAPGQHARIASFGLTVRTTGLPLSPMLLGVLRPCLLLPAHLSTLDASQQQLIVAHELTHLRRRDPLWLMLSGALGMAFWFNLPLRRLDGGLREAVELGCDDAVLAGRSTGERRGYAAALIAQLRLQLREQTQACAAPAFGSLGVMARVQRMQAARPPRLSRWGRMLAGASLLGFAGAGAALQPTFSADAVAPPAPMLSVALQPPAMVTTAWRYPLAEVRVTTLYGVRSPSVPTGNHGIDLQARRGTPVYAVAAGTVSEAAFNPIWGHYVRVDHGGGSSSLLIHLESIAVSYGRHVAAGDVLGASGSSGQAGSSGKAAGPHLHLEYWHQGRRLDPGIMLANLSDHATPKALARRQAQGNPVPSDQ